GTRVRRALKRIAIQVVMCVEPAGECVALGCALDCPARVGAGWTVLRSARPNGDDWLASLVREVRAKYTSPRLQSRATMSFGHDDSRKSSCHAAWRMSQLRKSSSAAS